MPAKVSSSTALAPLQTDPEKQKKTFIDKYCRSDVSEEWTKVDDKKIAKLRGILAALQEENQETQLLKKASEDKEARRELESTRKGVDARMAACKEKEELFARRQNELKRHVLENEKSLQELQSNIEKGEKKSKDEEAECRKLDAEIRDLDSQLACQEDSRSSEQKKIDRTARYRRFLEMVVQECEEDFEGDIEILMNRHNTLEAGNRELHQSNAQLTSKLDRMREEFLRETTQLQNEHLMISSQLHECQVTLDHIRAEAIEEEQRLNRALQDKELKESQVGVIQMAIEQLFSRTVNSCRLKQRRKAMVDATDIKYAPVRGEKPFSQLDEKLRQIIERVEDLRDMYDMAKEELNRGRDAGTQAKEVVDEGDLLDKIKIYKVGERQQRHHDHSSDNSNSENLALNARDSQTSSMQHRHHSGDAARDRRGGGDAEKQDTFLTQD